MAESQVTTPSVDDHSFAALFENAVASTASTELGGEGQIVTGRVVHVGRDNVIIDIGGKSEGVISLAEFADAQGVTNVKPGDMVDVFIESRESDEGMISLSKEKADKMKVWDEISAACERDEIIEGTISQRVKGGLSVTIRGGVKAFLPGSPGGSPDPSAIWSALSVRRTNSRSSSSTRSGATSCSRAVCCSSRSATP